MLFCLRLYLLFSLLNICHFPLMPWLPLCHDFVASNVSFSLFCLSESFIFSWLCSFLSVGVVLFLLLAFVFLLFLLRLSSLPYFSQYILFCVNFCELPFLLVQVFLHLQIFVTLWLVILKLFSLFLTFVLFCVSRRFSLVLIFSHSYYRAIFSILFRTNALINFLLSLSSYRATFSLSRALFSLI